MRGVEIVFNNKIEVENKIYDLNYDVSRLDNGGFMLSVLKKYNDDIVDKSTVRLVPITFDSVVEMAEVMCRNTVTPIGFRDIVDDMVLAMAIVE